MPRLGMGELLVILVIVVVLFGANKLPQLGHGLGQGIRSFKKALSGDDDKEEATKQSTGGTDTKSAPKQ